MINEEIVQCKTCKSHYPESQLHYYKQPYIDIRQFLPATRRCDECRHSENAQLEFWEKKYGLQSDGTIIFS